MSIDFMGFLSFWFVIPLGVSKSWDFGFMVSCEWMMEIYSLTGETDILV